MTCEICGEGHAQIYRHPSIHDGVLLCIQHALDYMNCAMTDDWSLLRYLSEAPATIEPTNIPSEGTVNVRRDEPSPIMRHGWPVRAPRNQGASTESDAPRTRTGMWVNAFTHRATDPRKAWPETEGRR